MSKLISYMFNKRNLPIVLIVSALGIAFALKTFAFSADPPTKYEKILQERRRDAGRNPL